MDTYTAPIWFSKPISIPKAVTTMRNAAELAILFIDIRLSACIYNTMQDYEQCTMHLV